MFQNSLNYAYNFHPFKTIIFNPYLVAYDSLVTFKNRLRLVNVWVHIRLKHIQQNVLFNSKTCNSKIFYFFCSMILTVKRLEPSHIKIPEVIMCLSLSPLIKYFLIILITRRDLNSIQKYPLTLEKGEEILSHKFLSSRMLTINWKGERNTSRQQKKRERGFFLDDHIHWIYEHPNYCVDPTNNLKIEILTYFSA